MSDTTRYIVQWQPAADVEALAVERGMKEGDNSSYWDWVDLSECEQTQMVQTFAQAVEVAKANFPIDVCGEVTISREHLVNDLDDLGTIHDTKSWCDDATWSVTDEDEQPDEYDPDFTYPYFDEVA